MQSPPTINVLVNEAARIDGSGDNAEQLEQNTRPNTALSRSLSDIYGSLSSVDAPMAEATIEEVRAAIASQRLVDPHRKYFDSGDYAMLKAKGASLPVPIVHARPETIPQRSPFGSLGQCSKSSPVRDQVVSADDLAVSAGNFETLSLADPAWTVTNNNQD